MPRPIIYMNADDAGHYQHYVLLRVAGRIRAIDDRGHRLNLIQLEDDDDDYNHGIHHSNDRR